MQNRDNFDFKLLDEDLIDDEQQIKINSVQQNVEPITRSVDSFSSHHSNQLNDNLKDHQSKLQIDGEEEENDVKNRKYHKLRFDQKSFSFVDWLHEKVLNPIKTMFDPQSEVTKPVGVILFYSPITPFAYCIVTND